MGAAASLGEAELADMLEETTPALVLPPQMTPSWHNVVGVKGVQKQQPISFPAFSYRKHLVPSRAVSGAPRHQEYQV